MILSELFIENVEFIAKNIREKKNKYLFKKDLLFENYIEKLKSKNNSIFEKKNLFNTNLELQTLNKFIKKIKSIDLKSLKLNQNNVFHNF